MDVIADNNTNDKMYVSESKDERCEQNQMIDQKNQEDIPIQDG
jgi:hypothetical protein